MASRLLGGLLLAAVGCASEAGARRDLVARAAAHERTRCETDAAALAEPALLEQRGDEALAARQLERAYCYFALLRTLHRDSREANAAFAKAARVFAASYLRERFRAPQAIWFTSEPAFLFAWLEEKLGGEEFPQRDAEALLLGLPRPVADQLGAHLEASAANVPWRVEVGDDNGRIDEVRGVRRE